MNKWIAIPVISVLAVGVIVCGVFLRQQTTKLGDTKAEVVTLERNVATLEGDIATLEGDVTTLEGTVSTLEGDISTLETDLTESEATVSTLGADLYTANAEIEDLEAEVWTQQTLNSELTDALIVVADPRHFASLSELTDWLYQDDTDTEYADERTLVMSYILQVRALWDGYLLPVDVDVEDGDYYVSNSAAIGDELYWVYAWDDDTDWACYINPAPSHPIPWD